MSCSCALRKYCSATASATWRTPLRSWSRKTCRSPSRSSWASRNSRSDRVRPSRRWGRARVGAARLEAGQAVLRRAQAEQHRPRERAGQQQELHDVGGVHRRAVAAPEGLRARRRLQRLQPVVEAAGGAGRDELAVAHVEQAAGHLGPLEHPAEHQEPPAVVARHRLARHAGDHLAAALHEAVELVGPGLHVGAQVPRPQLEVEAVDRLPQLARDELAGRPGRSRGPGPPTRRWRRGCRGRTPGTPTRWRPARPARARRTGGRARGP